MLPYLIRYRAVFLSVVVIFLVTLMLPGQEMFDIFQGDHADSTSSVDPPATISPAPQPVATNTVYKPALFARAALVYDVASKTILFEKNIDERLLPASTTKIMTALVALDEYELDDVLIVARAHESIGSTAELAPGDELRIIDVLRALMISSGNDAAVALALHHPQGYQGFVRLMNEKAKNLGLRNSHFANVSGVESPNHYMSARDLMHLTQVAMDNLLFRDIVGTKQTTIKTTNGNRFYHLTSTNILLGEVEGVEGVKTGWTGNAKECLVTQTRRSNATVITVVLGSDDRFGDTRQLIEWAFANHTWMTDL